MTGLGSNKNQFDVRHFLGQIRAVCKRWEVETKGFRIWGKVVRRQERVGGNKGGGLEVHKGLRGTTLSTESLITSVGTPQKEGGKKISHLGKWALSLISGLIEVGKKYMKSAKREVCAFASKKRKSSGVGLLQSLLRKWVIKRQQNIASQHLSWQEGNKTS